MSNQPRVSSISVVNQSCLYSLLETSHRISGRIPFTLPNCPFSPSHPLGRRGGQVPQTNCTVYYYLAPVHHSQRRSILLFIHPTRGTASRALECFISTPRSILIYLIHKGHFHPLYKPHLDSSQSSSTFNRHHLSLSLSLFSFVLSFSPFQHPHWFEVCLGQR